MSGIVFDANLYSDVKDDQQSRQSGFQIYASAYY